MDNIRNLSVIAHIDHGKSTLTDAFVSRAGLISSEEAGTKRWTDNREDEKERGITIKSTGVSMGFDYEGQKYHVNLVDSPGHVDFSSEVSAALRITDGAIVVVDAVEGVAVQTETVLRQALAEQVKPILLINKMDRYIFELQLTPEEAYDKIVKIIEQVNHLVSTYQSENSELDLKLSPEIGTVYFGSGLHGWGFGIHNFARRLAKKTKKEESYFMKRLWGEYFFDPATNGITSQSMKDGKPLERTFCKFILKPIFGIVKAIMNKETDAYTKMFDNMELKLSPKDLEKTEKDLYKLAMRKFLPIADSLLYGIVNKLPSPKEAQKYRYTTLYDGPTKATDPECQEDECATAIKNCDPNGPLMIYISKMIPMDDGGRFYAFGRVFSGTVSAGQKIRILGTNYKVGSTDDVFENKTVQRVARMVGGRAETCESVECGNTVALVGIDQYVLKSCTITTHSAAYPIKTMKFSVSPVVRVSVAPKNPADLPKLVEGMKKLSKSDPCVQVIITETGEYIVAGVGELHIEICLNDLKAFVKSDIRVSEPVVPFRETVVVKSNQICLSKSPNKHNRLYMTAEPIDQGLVERLENKNISSKMDVNERSKILVTEYGWDQNESKKIWEFGPTGDEETNAVVDVTRGVQFLNEIEDHVNNGFQVVATKGVLCEEPLRGVRFNLQDVTLHADAVHRGGGQMLPTTRRVMYAAMLTAQPTLMEPVYLVEIQVPDNYTGTIYSCLNHKKGRVISEEKLVGNLNIIKGYLPVRQSFGFNGYIREQTSGQAFPQMVFDYWQVIDGDVFDKSSELHQLVRSIRKRKGLKEDIPDLSEYLDKL